MATVIVHPGDKVKDRISGLTGIATSRTEFLYGCVRVAVQPQELKDGKPVEATYIDEAQLQVLTREAVIGFARLAEQEPAPAAARRHGPRDDCQRAPDATR